MSDSSEERQWLELELEVLEQFMTNGRDKRDSDLLDLEDFAELRETARVVERPRPSFSNSDYSYDGELEF